MGLYRDLYPKVEAAVLDPLRNGIKHSIHGFDVRLAFIEALAGRTDVDNRAERLLVELVLEGVLVHDPLPEPTISQSAFFSLHNMRKHPGWAPGTIEHFRYYLASKPV